MECAIHDEFVPGDDKLQTLGSWHTISLMGISTLEVPQEVLKFVC